RGWPARRGACRRGRLGPRDPAAARQRRRGPAARPCRRVRRHQAIAMVLGKVIGTLVASRKEPTLEGLKLLVVRACDVEGNPTGGIAIAVDAVGAGIGEVVLYAAGSSARQTQVTQNRPVDATIMAIVDEIAIGGVRRYVKD